MSTILNLKRKDNTLFASILIPIFNHMILTRSCIDFVLSVTSINNSESSAGVPKGKNTSNLIPFGEHSAYTFTFINPFFRRF